MLKDDSGDLKSLTMNQLPINRSFPTISDEASTSSISRDDREKGSHSLQKLGKVLLEKLMFGYSLDGVNLDPVRMVVAEFVGTFILMFCICGIIAITELLKGNVGLLEYAATVGLTVVIVVFAIGHISCAHVNPAVTISFAIFSSFPWSRVPLYIVAQLTGSVSATFVAAAVYGVETNIMTTRPIHGSSSAFWVEFIATFIIVFLAASVSYNYKSVGYLSGIVMGMAIAVAVMITGPVSGGSLNPARSLGPAIVSWDFHFMWIYVAAPISGAITGALAYCLLQLEHKPAVYSPESCPSASLLGCA
ncbi:probable aquaporin NIP7-1 [Punica granatum]|nr:probable aquaporin NIP7-1 [Punica granatum]